MSTGKPKLNTLDYNVFFTLQMWFLLLLMVIGAPVDANDDAGLVGGILGQVGNCF